MDGDGNCDDISDVYIDEAGDSTGALSSDLNIDANTFVISYDDDKVGIGTASPSDLLTVSQILTSGSALEVIRNLDSDSTDSPVINIIQDNAGDNQRAVSIQNDGSGPGLYIDNFGTGKGIKNH